MNTRWTLHVENFAKIASADIEVASFVGIVGENNTGKSYLLSLLWGLMSQETLLKHSEKEYEAEECKKCLQIFEEHGENSFALSKEEMDCFIDYYNYLLRINKERLLKRIFNYDVTAGTVEIRVFQTDKAVEIVCSPDNIGFSAVHNRHELRFKMGKKNMNNTLSCAYFIVRYLLFSHMIGTNEHCLFLPASRTGFMLTYPQLVDQSLEDMYSFNTEPRVKTQLTQPYIRFLQFITGYRKAEEKNPDDALALFVENELTHGKVISTEDKMPVFKYRPEDSEGDFPLHVSSSIVTEVAPLLMAFRDNARRDVYFIEEPEAHLHPALQKKMAQLLIRMANGQKNVFISTHSDTIIQHINNMLMLKKIKTPALMKKYGYGEEDLLDFEDVNLYQFVHDEDGRSVLMPLERTPYGFVVPTFNDSLADLLDETYAFQGDPE